ncbi:MAG: hypothetical protein DRQ59_05935 [Gammaproteobacteria bacterium]|nr:MAG: hypothetical protein DRQ59_05935 [Gammaproteobacteria bacterium]
MKPNRSIGIWIMTAIAVVFGLLTIKSGGSVLFIDGIAREEAGNYVPFVLWFNFLAGFAYLLAAAGLIMQKHWAVWISILIAVATIVVFALLGLHIFSDGLYEVRTVIAMSLRTAVWTLIATFAYRLIIRRPDGI